MTQASLTSTTPKRFQENQLRHMANAIRLLTIDAIQAANSGHPGMPLGMADVAAVLWAEYLRFNPKNPTWCDRDRFILSAGHGSMLHYALLYLTGFQEMSLDEIKRFRQLGSRTPGHPEYGITPGVEVTTGPLAQGLGHGVGMALAEAMLRTEFGADLVNHKTYVVVGDGCLMEGLSQEAISFAGHLGLSNLVILFDDNGITIDGSTSLATSEDQQKRFQACGWDTLAIDGHNITDIRQALTHAQEATRPTLIACRTVIGYGSPQRAGTAKVHGSPLGVEEVAHTKEALGLGGLAPFEVPEDTLKLWRTVGDKGETLEAAWKSKLEKMPDEVRTHFKKRLQRSPLTLTTQDRQILDEHLGDVTESKATRQWSQCVLNGLQKICPGLVGGSADLTGSNNTQAQNMIPVSPHHLNGNYIHYGIREHLMGAAMGGMVLHGGFVPYVGTFLTFSDYMRPAIRLAALMKIPSIFVLTHDSIGLGEDGPTHQPIEQLASLRIIPNLYVFRPADALETAACWEAALARTEGPSCILLSRQAVPSFHGGRIQDNPNLGKKGAYLLQAAQGKPRFVLLASGSEVGLARVVQDQLQNTWGIGTSLISVSCLEAFRAQPSKDIQDLLYPTPDVTHVVIEAATGEAWSKIPLQNPRFFTLHDFGHSAPAAQVYKAMGLDPEQIVDALKSAEAEP
jgi:transketolase